MHRRFLMQRALAIATASLLPGARAQSPTQTTTQTTTPTPPQQGPAASGRTIEVVARRFRFEPNTIAIRPGEAVTLAFTALDFVHGFSLPDLNLRADLIPGRVTPVALPAMKAGRYAFVCDNFCGDHHEDMSGTLIVGSPADG